MSNASLINIGLSGVRAHQAALAATGQNVTNASTPGYTRQRVALETQVTQGVGAGVQGVRVQGIERIYDEAAVNQLRLDTSVKARFDQLTEQLSQVDSLLADEASSLNRGFERLFGAFQGAANSPTSLPARQLVIAEAEGLVARFRGLDGRLRDQLDAVNRQVASEVTVVNRLAESIAALNTRLGPMSPGEGNTNALLDQRDELLRQLAEHVDVRVAREGELGVNVFVGKGQPLVVGTEVTPLALAEDGRVQIGTGDGEAASAVQIGGGSLGGLLGFRDQTLERVLNELGRLALSFAGTVNAVHAQGISLRGDYGGPLFADVNDSAVVAGRALAANAAANASDAAIEVRVENPAALVASDYRLSFTGSAGEAFEVRRESDGRIVAQGSVTGPGNGRVSFDGLSLTLAGDGAQRGAEFTIRAAGSGVANLSVALADPRDLALASPVSIGESAANRGSGRLALERISDVGNPLFAGDGALVPPLLVQFTSPTRYEVLDNSDPTNPQPLSPPIWGMPFVPGGSQPLLPDDGQRLLVSGGRDSGRLPEAVTTVSGLEAVPNQVGAETLGLLRERPGLGNSELLDQVEIAPGASARAVAAALEGLDGVSAAARTELSITDLQDNGLGQPLVVAVNGQRLTLPPGASLNDLADAISAAPELQAAGVRASSDGTTVRLSSEHGDDLSLHVAGDVSDAIEVADAQGRRLTLRGSGPGDVYETVTVGGQVRLLLDPGLRLTSDSASPGGGLFPSEPVPLPAALGFQAVLTGRPEPGDRFEISFNAAGNLDNHNALALAELQIRPTLGDPPVNFAESYSELVELVGIRTNQARTDAQAAAGLLEQSVARRESISGVNLEEEAANLIRFEQGYNASARVVSVARDIFDVLLGAVA